MPKLLHFPWLRRLLNRGVNTDVLPELMPEGAAREAINVRPGSITGNAGGAEAIKGEDVVYTVPVEQPDPTGYVLIGSCTCNNRLVEFWASESFDFASSTFVPIVRVDGVVVAQSRNIPYVWNRPLQIAVADDFFGTSISANEDANGVVTGRGVVYPADHNSAPLYWDISQLLAFAQSTPQNPAYFGDNYQVGFNSVGLFNTPEFPIHTRNLEVAIGLPVGQYQYALRYVTPAGDRTNIGPWTPLITVPLNQSEIRPWEQSHYPAATTVGGVPEQPSPYGIEIRYRVDNIYGFSGIEVVRKKYNTADNIGTTEVVSITQIQPNENSVITFIDPSDAISDPIAVPDDEANIKIIAVNKPKSVEYSDRRITYANFETFPKIASDVEFIERDGRTIFPVTQGVCTRWFDPDYNPNGPNPRENESNYTYWNDGYSDPVNNTYLKSFMRGERYGIGVMFWNQYTEQSFVREVPLGSASVTNEGYQFPNRRDKRLGRSFVYSGGYQGVNNLSTVQASNDLTGNPGGVVLPTFEAFSQGSVRKNRPTGGGNGQPWSGFGDINRLIFDGSTFSPFGPTNPVVNPTPANNQTRLSQSPNRFGYTTAVENSGSYPEISWSPESAYQVGTASGQQPLTGNIWAPRHYALGGMIEGVSNIPSNTTVMSVMRTAPAGRVVAQGIACWRVGQTGNTPTSSESYTKDLNRLSVLIPDFKNAVVSQSIIDLFETNPSSFGIQFVSPLGFYTEQYSGATRLGGLRIIQSGASDFLSYAGVQWDNGQVVNNGLETDAYTVPSSDAQYVGYGAWRSNAGIASNVWSSEGGNRVFSISNVESITENQYTKWDITISDNIYNYQFAGSGTSVTSNSSSVRNWHEPWYVVNIVIDEAVIPNDSIDKYVETGYHIKTESCIGITPSQNQQDGIYQDFPLLNERRGDVYASYSSVIQAYPSSSPGDAEHNRYVYVDNGLGVKPWLCVTDNFYANVNALGILAALSTDGFFTMPDGVVIYGVYSLIAADEWRSSSMEQFVGTVRFGQWISVLGGAPSLDVAAPPDGCRILVRYNSYEPIRFFGGDCTVSPSLDALSNRNFMYGGDGSISGNDLSNSFAVDGLPMPYRRWSKASGYEVPLISALPNGENIAMPDNLLFGQSAKRQWAVYWDAEQRSAIRHSSSSANGPFEWPRIGYLLKWAGAWTTNINDDLYSYPTDVDGYNLNTISNSALGGFTLGSSINPNYIKQAPVTGFGVPFVSSGGTFEEKFYFPTGLIASAEFNQLVQDSPSLRTFTELTLKTISEENGEIKTIASALAGGGRNLYAWTDNGVARVLTNKNVLTGASGELISTQAVENYWGEEMWISRNIGIPDQMWQAFVKGYAPAGDGYADNFFWANRNSLYRMVGDSIIDIGREKFLAYMLPILRNYPRTYVPGTNGFYNAKYNEAWMSFNEVLDENNKASRKLVVFNPEINAWNGLYTYDFDGYTQVGNDVFGHRELQTFKLDQGWTINDATREASITVPMAVDRNNDMDSFKEFIRWRVVGSKPDKMQILDPDFVVMSQMPNPLVFPINPLWVKEYDGWEGWADRTLASYDSQRRLPQKRYFYLRLIWNTTGDKNATSLSGQLKPIK